MRLLLLASIASVIGATTARAHVNDAPLKHVCQVNGDTLSADSLKIYYWSIDQLSVFDLKKWHESFVYRNRIQPSYRNTQILMYIEERLKAVK
jgi:hypothetical protein